MSKVSIPLVRSPGPMRPEPPIEQVVRADPLAATAGDLTPVSVPKSDLVRAWSFLEKLVVSLRTIGGAYATPDEHTELSAARRLQMLEDLDRFLDSDFYKEAARARRALVDHLDGEETEAISDAMTYFKPSLTVEAQSPSAR